MDLAYSDAKHSRHSTSLVSVTPYLRYRFTVMAFLLRALPASLQTTGTFAAEISLGDCVSCAIRDNL